MDAAYNDEEVSKGFLFLGCAVTYMLVGTYEQYGLYMKCFFFSLFSFSLLFFLSTTLLIP